MRAMVYRGRGRVRVEVKDIPAIGGSRRGDDR